MVWTHSPVLHNLCFANLIAWCAPKIIPITLILVVVWMERADISNAQNARVAQRILFARGTQRAVHPSFLNF